ACDEQAAPVRSGSHTVVHRDALDLCHNRLRLRVNQVDTVASRVCLNNSCLAKHTAHRQRDAGRCQQHLNCSRKSMSHCALMSDGCMISADMITQHVSSSEWN